MPDFGGREQVLQLPEDYFQCPQLLQPIENKNHVQFESICESCNTDDLSSVFPTLIFNFKMHQKTTETMVKTQLDLANSPLKRHINFTS